MTVSEPRVIVALDFDASVQALEFVEKLPPGSCRLKVGKELFTSAGPELVKSLVDRGFEVFLDLKFHDIPNTVRKAVYAASQLGVWMVNVHASGGRAMLAAAREGVEMSGSRRPFLIAVTVLTSLSERDMGEIGIAVGVEKQVERLAALAFDSGLDGLVCSAREAASIREKFGPEPLLVTPGIRPEGADSND